MNRWNELIQRQLYHKYTSNYEEKGSIGLIKKKKKKKRYHLTTNMLSKLHYKMISRTICPKYLNDFAASFKHLFFSSRVQCCFHSITNIQWIGIKKCQRKANVIQWMLGDDLKLLTSPSMLSFSRTPFNNSWASPSHL